MVLGPGGEPFVICEDEVGKDRNSQHPVVGLDDENLRHEPVEAAKGFLLGGANYVAADVHRRRSEKV